MIKISYSINSINKTNIFDGDDPISVLFSDAKQLLNENQFDMQKNCFSINGEIVDKNILIKDRFEPDSRVKLRVETIIPLSFVYYDDIININAYEDIKISDTLQSCNDFQDIDSYKFFYVKNKIDIHQTPKQLGISPDTSIIVTNASDEDPTIHSQLVVDFDSSSQSFEKKIDTQNDKIQLMNENLQKSFNTNNNLFVSKTTSLNSSILSRFPTNDQNASPTKNNSPQKHNSPPILSLREAIFQEFPDAQSTQNEIIAQPAQNKISIPSIPHIYTAKIIVKDESGDDNTFEINRTDDASQMAESLIDITASDVIDAYCVRCGVEPEAFCLFSSKWERLKNDYLIWKLFVRKRKIKKTGNETTDNPIPVDNLTRITNFLQSHPSPSVDLYIRLNKDLLSHFDIMVGSIPFDMQEDQLYERFKGFGNITDLVIFKNKKNESRGFARITFEREIDAMKAVELGKTLRYNDVFLNVFRPKLYYAISSKRKTKNVFLDREKDEMSK